MTVKMTVSKNGSNGSKPGGNTRPPAKTIKKTDKHREAPKKSWCMTLNNYTETEYNDLKKFFGSNGSNIWIIGKETGEEKFGDLILSEAGTPHLQMFCHFDTKIRFTALKKINPKMHIAKCRGSVVQNLMYCSKEGNYETNGRIPKPLVKMTIDKLSGWQLECLEFFKQDEDPLCGRKIYWIHEPVGRRGKTQLATYLVDQKHWIILSGKAADMKYAIQQYVVKNGEGPPGIVIDVPRTSLNYLSYAGIEEIKNGCFFSGKYEGGTVRYNRPHVLIFANDEPNLCDDTGNDIISRDRWVIREIVDNKLKKDPLIQL